MNRPTQDPPTPRDELTSIAGRIMGIKKVFVLAPAYDHNALLDDARKLAAFVLRSDTEKGANKPARKRKTNG
jgi:hypothetical protein